MLAMLLRPDARHARVLGHDIFRDADAVRGRVSLTGQFASVDEDLTGRENLVLLVRLLGHSRAQAKQRAQALLETFGLTDAAARLVMTLILVSVYTGVGLNTDITKGIFDRFRSMPIWRPATLVGALLGDAARNTLAARESD